MAQDHFALSGHCLAQSADGQQIADLSLDCRSLEGGAGSDTIRIIAGCDTVYGGHGVDVVDDLASSASNGNDLVYGGAGDHIVWGKPASAMRSSS